MSQNAASNQGPWADSENSVRGVLVRAVPTPSRSNGSKDASLGGSVPIFLRKLIPNCDFPGGILIPCPPFWILAKGIHLSN